MAGTTSTGELEAVDLQRYPIDALDGTAARELIARSRAQLATTGICQLPGFLRPGHVAELVEDALRLLPLAWATDSTHTVYFEPVDPTVAATHPKAVEVRSAKHAIAYDLIAADSPIRRLYESDALTRFVAEVLGTSMLHRSIDPLDALELAAFSAGEELGWHFDRSEFSVTIMLQESEAGGHFDYHPALRTDDEPHVDRVADALDGTLAPTRITTAPGTLAVFHGRNALHRVTRVSGPTPRINAVLTYGEHPGMHLDDLTQQLFYGRIVRPE
ncbi:MAG: hypothetical protein JWN62_3814 [Acidimicrobiales bacterium]|nr:hypothetical protein [Acidimicrobiales bacterium]